MSYTKLAALILILLIAGGDFAVAEKPFLFAHYYTWYSTPDGGQGRIWGQWSTPKPSLFYPKGASPERVIFPPFFREITSCAYPLIGPYNSDDPAVVKWHIQLAQAAGIDAFLVDWWGAATWQNPKGLTCDAFVKAVLPVAEELNFKVCLFDETPQFVADLQQVKDWIVTYLGEFKKSKAYLHIDGKPVYAIYQTPEGRLTPEEATDIHDYVESKIGPVYWIMDRTLCRLSQKGGREYDLFIPDEWLALPWVDCFMGYSTFGIVRLYEYQDMRPLYNDVVKAAHLAGHKILVPVHPGHNNSKITEEPWVMPRQNGKTLRDYLKCAEESDADFVAVTSFNEWPETTVVEPARTWSDPYQYLKILASWKGKTFSVPTEPELVKKPQIME